MGVFFFSGGGKEHVVFVSVWIGESVSKSERPPPPLLVCHVSMCPLCVSVSEAEAVLMGQLSGLMDEAWPG